MDSNGKNENTEPLISTMKSASDKVEENVAIREEDDNESEILLLPGNCEISENTSKNKRKVQWSDVNGNKLAEVVEYHPSDAGDVEGDSDSCYCTIM